MAFIKYAESLKKYRVTNLRASKSSLLVATAIAFGIIANFLKEIVLSYYYGTSQIVDTYRVVSFMPYAFYTSMATIITGVYLPKVINGYPEQETFLITRLCFFISLLAIVLSPFYIRVIAPGFPENSINDVLVRNAYCWLIFFIGSIFFHLRIKLLAIDRKVTVATVSLISGCFFSIVLLLLTSLFGPDEMNIYIAFCAGLLSVLIILYIINRKLFDLKTLISSTFNPYKKSPVTYSLLLIAVSTHFIVSISRVIDRAYLSTTSVGMISSLDYAYNIYIAFGMLMGSLLVILLTSYIAKFHSKSYFLLSLLNKTSPIIFMAICIAILIFIIPEFLVNIIYSRGAFVSESSLNTSLFLKYVGLGLPFMIWNMILLQAALAVINEYAILASAIVKVLTKLAFIDILFDNDTHLSIGVSNIASEIAFMIMIGYFFYIYNKNKAVKI